MKAGQIQLAVGALVVLTIGIGLHVAGVFDYFSMQAYSDRWTAKRESAQQGADTSNPETSKDLAGDPPRAELTGAPTQLGKVGLFRLLISTQK